MPRQTRKTAGAKPDGPCTPAIPHSLRSANGPSPPKCGVGCPIPNVRFTSTPAGRNAKSSHWRRRGSGSNQLKPFFGHRPAAAFFRLNRSRLIHAPTDRNLDYAARRLRSHCFGNPEDRGVPGWTLRWGSEFSDGRGLVRPWLKRIGYSRPLEPTLSADRQPRKRILFGAKARTRKMGGKQHES